MSKVYHYDLPSGRHIVLNERDQEFVEQIRENFTASDICEIFNVSIDDIEDMARTKRDTFCGYISALIKAAKKGGLVYKEQDDLTYSPDLEIFHKDGLSLSLNQMYKIVKNRHTPFIYITELYEFLTGPSCPIKEKGAKV